MPRSPPRPPSPPPPPKPLDPVPPETPAETLIRGGRAASSLDNVIHQRVRLGVAAALAAAEPLAFTDLKRLLDVTDGNLSVHLRKLEDAGYVSCDKSFRRRRPVTRYCLTSKGRRALEEYLAHMESLIGAARTPLEP